MYYIIYIKIIQHLGGVEAGALLGKAAGEREVVEEVPAVEVVHDHVELPPNNIVIII